MSFYVKYFLDPAGGYVDVEHEIMSKISKIQQLFVNTLRNVSFLTKCWENQG